jgi:hypothetical protein
MRRDSSAFEAFTTDTCLSVLEQLQQRFVLLVQVMGSRAIAAVVEVMLLAEVAAAL